MSDDAPAPTAAPPQVPPPPPPPAQNDEDEAPIEVEQLRLHLREVFVYSVPRLVSAKGYRAEELDLPNPLLTGYLKVRRSLDHSII